MSSSSSLNTNWSPGWETLACWWSLGLLILRGKVSSINLVFLQQKKLHCRTRTSLFCLKSYCLISWYAFKTNQEEINPAALNSSSRVIQVNSTLVSIRVMPLPTDHNNLTVSAEVPYLRGGVIFHGCFHTAEFVKERLY